MLSAKYSESEYFVEGVGDKIVLIDEKELTAS